MKTCARCKMAIDIRQEQHIKIEDKNGSEVLSKLYYHRQCWSEIMTGKAELANLQKQTAGLLKGVCAQLGIKEEYVIS